MSDSVAKKTKRNYKVSPVKLAEQIDKLLNSELKLKLTKSNVIISHYKIYRLQDKVYVNFYYYNAGIEEKKYRFQISFLVNLLRRKRKF